MPKTAPTPTKMVKVKLYYFSESESGLALRFVDAATAEKAKRTVWLPISQIYKTVKLPIAAGEDYAAHELLVPEWLLAQKNIRDFLMD